MIGLYWHFVDIVWIFLFPLLYLLGRHSSLSWFFMSEHIVPVRVYITIFLVLLVGTALTVARGVRRFSVAVQHDRRTDYRYDKGNLRRALFHARALQFTTGLGDCGCRVVLDGNFVRVYVCRLLDAAVGFRLDPLGMFTRPVAVSFPAPRSSAYTKGSSNEWWRLMF